MRVRIEIDEVLCDGCGVCIPSCSQDAIGLVDGKARLRGDGCPGLAGCLGACPRGAVRLVPTGDPEEAKEIAGPAATDRRPMD